MSDDFLHNLQSLTNNIDDIAFTRYATITNINNDNTIDCKEDNGTTHKNVINTTNTQLSVDDLILLTFADNNIYQPHIIGAVKTQNPLIVDEVKDGEMRPITSNAVYDAIGDINEYILR